MHDCVSFMYSYTIFPIAMKLWEVLSTLSCVSIIKKITSLRYKKYKVYSK